MLQPLRIPAGWTVKFNDFTSGNAPEDLKEDLLQLYHARRNCLIDLGWYGENAKDGAFLVVALRGDFQGQRLAEFRSADRNQVVAELERLLVIYG